MAMSREKQERELADSGNYFEYSKPAERKHAVHLNLGESDLALLYRLMDLGVSKSKEAITRAKNFPSDSNASQMTIEKHTAIIDKIETLRSHLCEESQW